MDDAISPFLPSGRRAAGGGVTFLHTFSFVRLDAALEHSTNLLSFHKTERQTVHFKFIDFSSVRFFCLANWCLGKSGRKQTATIHTEHKTVRATAAKKPMRGAWILCQKRMLQHFICLICLRVCVYAFLLPFQLGQ